MTSDPSLKAVKQLVTKAAADPSLVQARYSLAQFTAETFDAVGQLLHVGGHFIGSDRATNTSPFGHGSDETVAISTLLRIASELVSSSSDLFEDGRHYAAASLLRQIVEIEYLVWAFETRDKDGERWLRSSKQERMAFFSPRKLRDAAKGKFRGKDYGYHCELGGHPVPGSSVLLNKTGSTAQLLLSDLLGHAGSIWDHVAVWAKTSDYAEFVFPHNQKMAARYAEWKDQDPLVSLPPPP